jgi:nicotinate-nucleotide--dimethylbenzimidazole phosphoribosyltransferase
MNWQPPAIPAPSEVHRARALARQTILTKPPGALGRLETLAVTLAALQADDRPGIDPVAITIFAADHGIAAAEGVSAFPQAVTAEMVRNFAMGGAAIAVLARALGARLEVVDVGVLVPPVLPPGTALVPVDARVAAGTRSFLDGPAMTEAECHAALAVGAAAVARLGVGMGARSGAGSPPAAGAARIFIGGEMGIGNTTAASALACLLLDAAPGLLVGPGTGLDPAGVMRKRAVVTVAIELHRLAAADPLTALAAVGGLEIAALVGAYLAAAAQRLPCLVDGFIATVAALCAVRVAPPVAAWFLYAHGSAEPGHRPLLEALGAEPLLDLGLRLGEGSGAALALPLLRHACALHNDMSTFAEAAVSERLPSDGALIGGASLCG